MLWLPFTQDRLSITCTLLRFTNVGVCVSVPRLVSPETEMLPKRVPGTKNRFESIGDLGMLSVASYAWFQATLAELIKVEEMSHLCSPTTDCVFVLMSVKNIGMGLSLSTLALSNE